MKSGFVIVRAEANPAVVFLCLVSADLVVVAVCCYIYNEQLYRYGSRGAYWECCYEVYFRCFGSPVVRYNLR